MKKILLYGHGGAYNHGAEAIVRTSVPIFRQAGCPILLSTHFPEQDQEFGLDQLVDGLIPADLSLVSLERAAGSIVERERIAARIYRDAVAPIDSETVCIGIGGDNYCYPNWHRQSIFHRTVRERGGKSILWGCSIQPEQITDYMQQILLEHDHIYARESLTAAALRKCGINHITQMKDSAFNLPPEPVPLPENWGKHTVALNLSPLALRRSRKLMSHFVDTARWLLEVGVILLLIPHVTMPTDNDREALKELEQMLTKEERSRICWVADNLNAAERKYLISRCEMIICCRTHASIAGYSSGVPTLVLGYSVKSAGIGRDMGMENWVIPIEKSGSLMSLAIEMWKIVRARMRIKKTKESK